MKAVARACVPRTFRNWCRSPARSLRWAYCEARYAAGWVPIVQMRPGWSVRCHPAAYRFGYEVQEEDPAQRAEMDLFIRSCRPGMVLLDVGAHFGLFSLAALHYGGPGALAVAVEPSPAAARMLRIQAHLNGVERRLRAVRAAAAEQSGWTDLVAAGVLAAGYFVPPPPDHPVSERTRAPAVALDALTRDLSLQPTHLKIDVEGAEAAVLRGAASLLARDEGPLIFLELHAGLIRARGGDPAEPLGILRDFGYAPVGAHRETLKETLSGDPPLIRLMATRSTTGSSGSLA